MPMRRLGMAFVSRGHRQTPLLRPPNHVTVLPMAVAKRQAVSPEHLGRAHSTHHMWHRQMVERGVDVHDPSNFLISYRLLQPRWYLFARKTCTQRCAITC